MLCLPDLPLTRRPRALASPGPGGADPRRSSRQRGVAALALALLAASCGSLPSLRLTQRISDTSASGAFDSNGVDGTLNYSDVGLDDAQLTYEFRTEFDMEQVLLLADVRRIGVGGNGTLPTNFAVDGVTFDAGDVVRADSAIKLVRGLFLWKLMPDDPWSLDVGLGLAGVDTRFGLRDVFSGETASVDELGLVPFVAGRAIYRIGDFEFEGHASYIEGSFDLTDLRYLDLEFAGRWRFAGEADGFSAWAELGYRDTDLIVDFMDDPAQVDTNLGLSGPFAGLVIQF